MPKVKYESTPEPMSFGSFTYVEHDPETPEVSKEPAKAEQVDQLGKSAVYFVDDRRETKPVGWDYVEPEYGPAMHPTPDRGIRLTTQEAQDPQRLLEAVELQHFVRETPSFAEMAEDTSRTNEFTYKPYTGRQESVTMSEYQGLHELRTILADMIADDAYDESVEDLKDIYNNLTFMGEKELTEASAGIATLWRSYLQENPKNMLCVTTLYLGGDDTKRVSKSGPHVLGRILNNFTDEELTAYKGRIIDTPDELPKIGADPDHTRIVLVDDSTMSGSQLSDMLRSINKPELAPYFRTSKPDNFGVSEFFTGVEINLFVAQPELVERGYDWRNGRLQDKLARVPVKSYYKARPTDDNPDYNTSHTTGIHSSVDFGFEENIREAKAKVVGRHSPMPPLTQIERTYRTSPPDVIIEDDGTLRRMTSRHV
jgi:hypothetical protein